MQQIHSSIYAQTTKSKQLKKDKRKKKEEKA